MKKNSKIWGLLTLSIFQFSLIVARAELVLPADPLHIDHHEVDPSPLSELHRALTTNGPLSAWTENNSPRTDQKNYAASSELPVACELQTVAADSSDLAQLRAMTPDLQMKNELLIRSTKGARIGLGLSFVMLAAVASYLAFENWHKTSAAIADIDGYVQAIDRLQDVGDQLNATLMRLIIPDGAHQLPVESTGASTP